MCMYMSVFTSRNLGEECDDGDLLSGDGCSRTCNLEEGFNCAGEFRNTRAGSCPRVRGILMSYFCELLISCTIQLGGDDDNDNDI